MTSQPENIRTKIEGLKRDLLAIFGRSDAIVKGLELKIRYHQIGHEFYKVRKFSSYEKALEYVCQEFFVSKSTAKRAIQAYEVMVHKDGLKSEEQKT